MRSISGISDVIAASLTLSDIVLSKNIECDSTACATSIERPSVRGMESRSASIKNAVLMGLYIKSMAPLQRGKSAILTGATPGDGYMPSGVVFIKISASTCRFSVS